MKFFNKKIKKTFSIILMVVLISSTVFFYNPQEAKAGLFDDAATWGVFIKETLLDGIAYAIGNVIVANMSQLAVDWIRGGFSLPDGSQTNFFSEPGKFLAQSIDEGVGKFIKQEVPGLCSPFKIQIEAALETKYKSGAEDFNKCTFSEVTENIDNAFTSFSNDFDNGGWGSWVDYTVNPRNNPYGAFLEADAKLGVNVAGIEANINTDLLQGGGFLSLKEKVCPANNYAVKLYPPGYEGVEELAFWGEPGTNKFVSEIEDPNEDPPCVVKEEEKITTPGKFLSDQLTNSLGISGERLGVIDEVNEIVGALISQLVQTGFDALGLSNGKLDASEEGSSLEKVRKAFSGFQDEIVKRVEKYLDIKRVTMELIGKFDFSDTYAAQQAQKKIKIDWFGKDFEWLDKTYYGEKSSKVDWYDKLFNWNYNEFYSKDNKGEFYTVRCIIDADEGNEAFGVKNSGDTKDVWAKAKCEEVKDANGERIKTDWVVEKNSSGDPLETYPAYATTAGEKISCNQNNKNKTGHIVQNITDNTWSDSKCVSVNGAYNWEVPTKITDKTFRTEELSFYEIKLDWNGIAYEWDKNNIYWEDRRVLVPNNGTVKGNYDGNDPNYPYYIPGLLEGIRIENIESWAATELNIIGNGKQGGKKFNAPLTVAGVASGEKACWPKGESVKVYIINEDGMWEKYDCTGDFGMHFSLGEFEDKTGFDDGEAAKRLGAWKKIGTIRPAILKIFLSSDEAKEILDKYGSVEIKDNFYAVRECLLKAGDTKEIDKKILERKNARLTTLVDLLYAEETLKNVKALDRALSGFLSFDGAKELDYNNLSQLISSIRETAGFEDEDIKKAQEEQDKIKEENEKVKNMCTE